MHKNKTIGILGGMGPAASANMYEQIIKYAQYQYGAVQDEEYPPVILYSLPLNGFDETGIVDEASVKKQLIKGVQTLESAGCDCIIIACNTVHVFFDDMQSAISIPIFGIIDEARKAVLKHGYKKVGLFASESTVKLRLYKNNFAQDDITVLQPSLEQQAILNRVIKHVMGGTQGVEDVIQLKSIAQDYIQQGAEAIVMGCTEIPLAINQTHTDIKLFNTIEIVAKRATDFSLCGM